ncbi:MAG: tRNA (guanosine(37)-N1)-methyltransferase TrmD [Oscillibacter sp.]|jgi:tRNA (guanine37-N1)-methyltransferase|nr:tRNA (guanosine(37)-N1)-methyltransferase TrmD [Oscillibacter sp.]
MRIDILTLFPEAVDAMLNVSILGRAQERGYITIQSHQIRSYTTNRQMQVDDYPYGGGRGAVMQADPLYRCWAHVRELAGEAEPWTVFLSPCGRTFTQAVARELKERHSRLILVCGHYEGVDQRFLDECVDEELSLGDFVLTGGEIPAMAVCDAVCRMIPGVLPDESCFTDESHWNGLLEYPQYSRPEEWHGRKVPEILLSGDHAKVDAWRKKESYKRTMLRRPDLFAKFGESTLTSKAERKILQQAKDEAGEEAAAKAAKPK